MIWPILGGHGLVDDGHGRRNVAIVLRKVPAFQKRDAHRGKIVEVHRVYDGRDGFGFLARLLPFDHDARLFASPQRQVRRPGNRPDAGNPANAVKHLFVKLLRTHAIVPGLPGIEHEQRQMLRLEAGIDDILSLDASQEEAGDHQQNKGNRHLPGQQHVCQADPTAAPSSGARFLLQYFRD